LIRREQLHMKTLWFLHKLCRFYTHFCEFNDHTRFVQKNCYRITREFLECSLHRVRISGVSLYLLFKQTSNMMVLSTLLVVFRNLNISKNRNDIIFGTQTKNRNEINIFQKRNGTKQKKSLWSPVLNVKLINELHRCTVLTFNARMCIFQMQMFTVHMLF
jgi:hypothetical protein